jgi:hypothetical protein
VTPHAIRPVDDRQSSDESVVETLVIPFLVIGAEDHAESDEEGRAPSTSRTMPAGMAPGAMPMPVSARRRALAYRNYIHPEKEPSHGITVNGQDTAMFVTVFCSIAEQIIKSVK